MNSIDTIAAISTSPTGRGGIGIIRISGKLVPIISPILLGKIPMPRTAEYLTFLSKDGSILDRVIAVFFPEPYSFTGENILEIHAHGGQMILDLLLTRILETSSNIRLANPGEFTERAFLNGKIDLIQAEAIADMIDAKSYQAAKSASNSLQGLFSKQIHKILKKITDLRTYIESSIDFSDEDIDTISYINIKKILNKIINDIKKIHQSAYHGMLIREGIKVVIAGRPNVGKSSLFNALIGIDRAITTSISGTTRDSLHESIQLNGVLFHIVDTAGLQKNSNDVIEKIGIERTWNELKNADHILWVISSNEYINTNPEIILHSIKEIFDYTAIINNKTPITIIRNKSDINSELPCVHLINEYPCITLSVLLNDGLDLLKKHLYDSINFNNSAHSYLNDENQGNFIARKRHLHIIKNSLKHLLSAQKKLNLNTAINSNISIDEFFAEDIKLAHNELNKMLGKFTSDDLLKEIFNNFCIGK